MPQMARKLLVRTTQETFTVSVAAIVTNEKNEVLLLDHVFRTGSGWGIPGGFMGVGEQPEKALRREISEETGLELKDLELIRVRTVNRHIEILFLANASGKAEVKSGEIKQAAWFKIDEMPEKMNKTQKKIIKNLLKSE